MTREQKIEWFAKASAKEIIEQLKRAAVQMAHGNVAEMIEGQEDAQLAEAELLKRIG